MQKELIRYVDALAEQLHQIHAMHEQLLLAVRGKQRAMRAGDMGGLDSWSARERFLLERIEAADQVRRDAAKPIGKALGLDDAVTLTELATRLEEPHRSKLLALAGAIRSTAEQVYQINQVNDAVTREILSCFAQMQRQVTAAHCDLGLYDPNGRKQMGSAVNILDAVG
jgi:flagellar biosynthesis/type III secretory pathway chaperone